MIIIYIECFLGGIRESMMCDIHNSMCGCVWVCYGNIFYLKIWQKMDQSYLLQKLLFYVFMLCLCPGCKELLYITIISYQYWWGNGWNGLQKRDILVSLGFFFVLCTRMILSNCTNNKWHGGYHCNEECIYHWIYPHFSFFWINLHMISRWYVYSYVLSNA